MLHIALFALHLLAEAKNHLGFRDSEYRPRDVPLETGAGWFSFQFREQGTICNTHFVFELAGPAMLKVADYFCAGDRFMVHDNREQLGPTGYVPFDNCASSTSSPDWAFAHPDVFSTAQFKLDAGWHKISVKTLATHYGGGSAAIRLDPILLQCGLKTADAAGLTLVQTPLRHDQAQAACDALGLQIADIDLLHNLASATDLVFQCLGAFQKVWIGSFEGEEFVEGACLALRTLVASPGGQVGIENDCQRALPVLCVAKPAA